MNLKNKAISGILISLLIQSLVTGAIVIYLFIGQVNEDTAEPSRKPDCRMERTNGRCTACSTPYPAYLSNTRKILYPRSFSRLG